MDTISDKEQADDPPLSQTPPDDTKCAGSCRWHKGNEGAFTPEHEVDAVRLVQVGDRSLREVAKALDLTETALREWTKLAGVDAGKGPSGART